MSSSQEHIKPLNSTFFSSLIKLETDFINKSYTAETLDELIDYYSQAVEYYDSIKDQIAGYFIYKIQDTLAQKKSLKLLMTETAKMNTTPKGNGPKDFFAAHRSKSSVVGHQGEGTGETRRKKSFVGAIIKENAHEDQGSDHSQEDEEEEEEEDDEDEFNYSDGEDEGLSMAEKRLRSKNRAATARKSIATLKKKTQKLFTLQMKLQNEKASAKQTMQAILDAFERNQHENNKIVGSNIAQQKRGYKFRLHEKLDAKRQQVDNESQECQEGQESSGSMVINDGSSTPVESSYVNA